MDHDHWDDRFVDMLLRESLAGERPPSLRQRVQTRIRASQQRWLIRLAPLLAAAVLALAALTIYRFWPQQPPPTRAYPSPEIKGAVMVDGNGPLQRGATLRTTVAKGEVVLGGYAQVFMQPNTELTLAGKANYAEEVRLTSGTIFCKVTSGKGRQFQVQTEVGTVSVVGTEFSVQMKESGMKEMLVRVLAGIVLVTGVSGEQTTLKAQEGGGNWISVGPGGIYQRPKGDETPGQKEIRALHLQQQVLRQKQQEIQDKALAQPAVVKLMKASQDAAAAFFTKLNENPEYKALLEQKKKQEEQQRAINADIRNLDANARRAKYKDMRAAWNEIRALNEKIVALPDQVPELAALKKAKQEAALAFLAKLEAILHADPEYVKLEKLLEEIQKDIIQTQQEEYSNRRQLHRRHQGGPQSAPERPEPVGTF